MLRPCVPCWYGGPRNRLGNYACRASRPGRSLRDVQRPRARPAQIEIVRGQRSDHIAPPRARSPRAAASAASMAKTQTGTRFSISMVFRDRGAGRVVEARARRGPRCRPRSRRVAAHAPIALLRWEPAPLRFTVATVRSRADRARDRNGRTSREGGGCPSAQAIGAVGCNSPTSRSAPWSSACSASTTRPRPPRVLLNTMLMLNLVPVCVFAIEAALRRRFAAIELAGRRW